MVPMRIQIGDWLFMNHDGAARFWSAPVFWSFPIIEWSSQNDPDPAEPQSKMPTHRLRVSIRFIVPMVCPIGGRVCRQTGRADHRHFVSVISRMSLLGTLGLKIFPLTSSFLRSVNEF